MRRHHPLRIAAVAGIIALPAIATTASAVTIGQTFDAANGCDGITVVETVPVGSTSFVVPSDGVLTSWSTSAESGGNRMAAVVYRQVGGNYTLVGISDTVVPTGVGVKTYPTHIAVKQGDLFGSWVERRNGGLDVQKTCSADAGPGQTTTWWYDTPDNVLPPTPSVPIADIGGGGPITGGHDTSWRYNISGEVGPPDPVPAAPSAPAAPVDSPTSDAATPASGSAATSGAPAPLAARWTLSRTTRIGSTRGTVPTGAVRITQTAHAGAASTSLAPWPVAALRGPGTAAPQVAAGRCTISVGRRRGARAATGRTYVCVIHLAKGSWTVTTTAVGASGTVAENTRTVVVP